MGIFSPKYEGSIEVVNTEFTPKSRLNQNTWYDVKPERKFSEQRYLINHDSRTLLSEDTYVQMTMGSGVRVKIKDNKSAEDAWKKWSETIDFDTKIEDGLHSYIGVGNMIFEKFPLFADIREVDITTVQRAMRTKNMEVSEYIIVNDYNEIPLTPDEVIHFKLTNSNNEVFGRGMYHALLTKRNIGNGEYESPLESMWIIEDAMKRIFESYASPIMMIHFEDAGEDFIKRQAIEMKKAKPGAKIITDKEFKVQVFEVNPASKFDRYIEHLQNDILEPGIQFPIQFFNAGFTARAASETSESTIIRKVKRMQKRLATQVKREIVLPYFKAVNIDVNPLDVSVMFEFDSKTDLSVQDIQALFEKGTIVRNEVRAYVKKYTTLELDDEQDGNTPPITSVTPTNDKKQPKDQKSKGKPLEKRINELKQKS